MLLEGIFKNGVCDPDRIEPYLVVFVSKYDVDFRQELLKIQQLFVAAKKVELGEAGRAPTDFDFLFYKMNTLIVHAESDRIFAVKSNDIAKENEAVEAKDRLEKIRDEYIPILIEKQSKEMGNTDNYNKISISREDIINAAEKKIKVSKRSNYALVIFLVLITISAFYRLLRAIVLFAK